MLLAALCLSSLFFFRDHPHVVAVQQSAVDTVAVATGVILAPVEAWERMAAAMNSRSELQDELLRPQPENLALEG